MKRVSLIVCLVLAMVLLCSCGKKSSSDTVNDVQISGSGNNVSNEKEKVSTSNSLSNNSLPYVYKDPGKAIAFNYNDDVQVIENGYARLFRRGDRFCVIFNRSAKTASSPLDKINDELLSTFEFATDSLVGGVSQQFVVKSSKEITINNIKTLRVEGYIPFKSEMSSKVTNCYMYGYTFEKDGVICQMIGCVPSEGQEKENIDEVTKRVDAMMQTLRDKR